MIETRYPVRVERDTKGALKLLVEGLTPRDFHQVDVSECEDTQDDIELLRLAVKDDLVPRYLFSDCDMDEPSTVYYVGVLPNMTLLISSPCTDAKGHAFLDIVNQFYNNKLEKLFVLSIEDCLV